MSDSELHSSVKPHRAVEEGVLLGHDSRVDEGNFLIKGPSHSIVSKCPHGNKKRVCGGIFQM